MNTIQEIAKVKLAKSLGYRFSKYNKKIMFNVLHIYECVDCGKIYHVDEPPEHFNVCDECYQDRKQDNRFYI